MNRLWFLPCLLSFVGCGRIGVELLPLDGSVEGDGGRCPTECENEHGTADCTSGRCVVSCSNGYEDCDGLPDNGCETSTASSVASCGQCLDPCTNDNGAAMCAEGVCTPTCSTGFADCDGDPHNGCESDLRNTARCGGCDETCTNDHGTTACVAAVCTPSCAAGFDDCDGDPGNGCETPVAGNPVHCGRCGRGCDVATQICVDGVCQMSPCVTGRGDCDANQAGCETDLSSSLANCSFCGNRCATANGTPQCVASACTIASCNAGFGNCDGLTPNGCETPLASTVVHCGACNDPCVNGHGTTVCTGASCVPTCTTGWDDCDGNPRNGCETSLAIDGNCGECGETCTTSVPGATAICAAGVCTTECTSMSGVYALKLSIATTWPGTGVLASGSGTMVYWARATLTQSGTSLTGQVVACGHSVPDFASTPLIGERYGVTFGAGLFDGALPSVALSGTLSSANPTATVSFAQSAVLAGVTLANPITSAWPSLGAIDATDHDGDGFRGIAMTYRSGGGYSNVPCNLFGTARASLGGEAFRARFALGGALTSCTRAAGSATVPAIDAHTVDCRLSGGARCSASQYGYLDDNAPAYNVQSASYVMLQVGAAGANVTCAQIRSAVP